MYDAYVEDLQRQVTLLYYYFNTAQKMKFSIKDLFSKCDQIHRKLQIWSHLPKKSLTENFIFCAIQSTLACENHKHA